jgi:hypothetical protein
MMNQWHRFWFVNKVLRDRVVLFRIVFFTLLSFDLWVLMLPHAPRYGINHFNISHLNIIDQLFPLPTVDLIGLLYIVAGFLSLCIAFSIASRLSLIILTLLYSFSYFWSQIDSYQHHYLICLILALSIFIPFNKKGHTDYEIHSGLVVNSWAIKLIYVQVSIVYFYTAVTKATEHWLNGWALDQIITTPSMRQFMSSWAEMFGWAEISPYAFTAHTIMYWQFFVSIAFLVPKLRVVACVTGPMFHVMVEVIGLKIGWFSYYMIAIYYILLFPNHWFMFLSRTLTLRGIFSTSNSIGRRTYALMLSKLSIFFGALSMLILYSLLDQDSIQSVFEYTSSLLIVIFMYPYYCLMRQRLNDQNKSQLIGWLFISPLAILIVYILSKTVSIDYANKYYLKIIWTLGIIIAIWSLITNLAISSLPSPVSDLSSESSVQTSLSNESLLQKIKAWMNHLNIAQRACFSIVLGMLQVNIFCHIVMIDHALVVASIIGGYSVLLIIRTKPSNILINSSVLMINLLLLVFSIRCTGSLFDYHRFWGGDLHRRAQYIESAKHYFKANQMKELGKARYYKLGNIYLKLNMRESALYAFQEAVRRQPNHHKARNSLLKLLSEGNQ